MALTIPCPGCHREIDLGAVLDAGGEPACPWCAVGLDVGELWADQASLLADSRDHAPHDLHAQMQLAGIDLPEDPTTGELEAAVAQLSRTLEREALEAAAGLARRLRPTAPTLGADEMVATLDDMDFEHDDDVTDPSLFRDLPDEET